MEKRKKSRIIVLMLITILATTSVACGTDNSSSSNGTDVDKVNTIEAKAPTLTVKSYRGSGKALLKWTEDETATGYMIYRSTKSTDGYKLVKTIKSNKKLIYTNSGLTVGKTYYYRMCSYTLNGEKKIAGALCQPKKVKALGAMKVDPKNKLMLVNKDNRLSSSYEPSSKYSLRGYQVQSVIVKKFVRDAFIELYKSAEAAGYDIKAVSGYRDYSLQKWLFNYYVSTDGLAEAQKYSARPGRSEHQTGLAIDVSCPSERWTLEQSFAKTPESKWLAKNCYKFGFIIRYPKGKQDITGYFYEPWHIRYVGTKAAKEIYEQKITLEEYLGYI